MLDKMNVGSRDEYAKQMGLKGKQNQSVPNFDIKAEELYQHQLKMREEANLRRATENKFEVASVFQIEKSFPFWANQDLRRD